MKIHRALLLSPSSEAWFLPAVLAQAGWSCEVVSLSGVYALSAHVHRLHRVPQVEQLAEQALQVNEADGGFDWVIVASDELLADLRQRSWLDRRYLPLLPLASPQGREHLFSKLQLSRLLDRCGLPTPRWGVATSAAEALKLAERLGYPCFLKSDASNGGRGVVRCLGPDELELQAVRLQPAAFLVQRELHGRLWGVEALFWQGRLQAYAASESLEEMHAFGPSVRRCYGRLGADRAALEALLQPLGEALAAHGWANLSLIQMPDRSWQCFEADLRPTVWLALDQALGGDFAQVIAELPQQLQRCPQLCYGDQLLELEHPQRLLQIGASQERISLAWAAMPQEAAAYLEALRQERFAARLPEQQEPKCSEPVLPPDRSEPADAAGSY